MRAIILWLLLLGIHYGASIELLETLTAREPDPISLTQEREAVAEPHLSLADIIAQAKQLEDQAVLEPAVAEEVQAEEQGQVDDLAVPVSAEQSTESSIPAEAVEQEEAVNEGSVIEQQTALTPLHSSVSLESFWASTRQFFENLVQSTIFLYVVIGIGAVLILVTLYFCFGRQRNCSVTPTSTLKSSNYTDYYHRADTHSGTNPAAYNDDDDSDGEDASEL